MSILDPVVIQPVTNLKLTSILLGVLENKRLIQYDYRDIGGSECRDAYRAIGGRATQEHLPGCTWLKTSGTSFPAKAEHILEGIKGVFKIRLIFYYFLNVH